MTRSQYRCTLTTPEGASRRVDSLGLVIGRQRDCDIVVDDSGASRRHALVRVDNHGAEVLVLGRAPVVWNDKPIERQQRLEHGDRLKVATMTLVVGLEKANEDLGSTVAFTIAVRGMSYGIRHTPFTIGGDVRDDLILTDLPPSAIKLHLADAELFIEPTVGGVSRNSMPLVTDEGDEITALHAGDLVEIGTTTIAIGRAVDDARTTSLGNDRPVPRKVVVEMLPRGGRVVMSMPSGNYCVYLADRRLDLLAALLKPPAPYKPGDYIPDDVLRPLVWPGNPGVVRSEINVHITRVRRDLVAAGLPGPRLIERAPGGGATRLAIATGCEIIFL